MLDMNEMDAESAELLPGREALSKLQFSFTKTVNVTKHIAHVDAANSSQAGNWASPDAVASSSAGQSISVVQ